MGVKKLRTVFMMYVSLLALAAVAAVAGSFGALLLCESKGAVISLYQKSVAIENVKETLRSAKIVAAEDIPPFCSYVLFTHGGGYAGGSIAQEDSATIWEKYVENRKTSDSMYLYTVIEREDGTLVLRYSTAAQFTAPALNRVFPSADVVLVVVIILEILCFLIGFSILFGRYLGKRMENLSAATQKIEQRDLDFNVEKSGIVEIDRVVDAIDHMRETLKESLTKQWQDDKTRQNQLSSLAHDLKTPLTIIRGNAELLLESALTNEQRESARYIEDSSVQMQSYVQTLIEATKSWDSYQLHMENVSLASLLEEVKRQISGLCSVNNIEMCWSCESQVSFFTADRDLFVRALVNILSNAVEHTPQGGTVSLEVKEENEKLSFVVCDTGNGFTPEALKHAAEQFFMDDNSRSSKAHYGMGLYIADSIIRQHGGRMILENLTGKNGAMVTLEMPV